MTVQPRADYAAASCSAPETAPELKLYLLPEPGAVSMQPERPLVIVVPGGGYEYCSAREAEPIAMKLLAAGIHAAVLRYSCAPARWPAAALELAWSIRYIRSRAAEWHVNAVAVCGFSAGGHLAGTLGTLWHRPEFAAQPMAEISCRPDFQLLCYSVLTLGEFTHPRSRDNLLGVSPDSPAGRAGIESLSLEKHVTRQTPPAFLWHTAADGSVPVENSLMYASACRRNGVPFELHVYETGGHGLATCEPLTARGPEQVVPDDTGWLDCAVRFIRRRVPEKA